MKIRLILCAVLTFALTACYPVSTLPADVPVGSAKSVVEKELENSPEEEFTNWLEAEHITPYAFGDWGEASNGSFTDGKWHDVKLRITKVTTESENEDYIENVIAYNNTYATVKFGEDETIKLEDGIDDAELIVVDYEVELPEDYPCDGNADVNLSVRDQSGQTQMIKLVTSEELDMTPGTVYAKRGIFARKRGDTNYVFESLRYQNNAAIEGLDEGASARALKDSFFSNK